MKKSRQKKITSNDYRHCAGEQHETRLDGNLSLSIIIRVEWAVACLFNLCPFVRPST